jgi:hypothetical protein
MFRSLNRPKLRLEKLGLHETAQLRRFPSRALEECTRCARETQMAKIY